MSALESLTANFGYYPRTMIRLCTIAYDEMASIPGNVNRLGWHVVWGPAEHVSILDIAYSLMFIAKSSSSDEYAVVIRGTNFDSWDAWTREDFAIGTTRPFNGLAPHAPESALISQGTYTGMTDLLSLTDPITGQSAAHYLRDAHPGTLYVTGHSLGGTLVPPMFAYLNDVLYGGGRATNMAPFSFAGLTPGNGGFNDYFNELFNPEFPWRMHNSLDIAPFCWWSLQDIRNIYQPYGLQWGFPEDDFIEDLFSDANGKGYAQPLGDRPLQGSFDESVIDDHLWVAQAMHQHHATTYQILVDAAFPEQ